MIDKNELCHEKTCPGFLTMFDTQLQKLARFIKLKLEFYISRLKNNGAAHLQEVDCLVTGTCVLNFTQTLHFNFTTDKFFKSKR